ncbi:unnamed protein product [Caenorhabditis auriculariae]|uniref:Integrase catalytic domain-containing protein n=1 Tax=Caenorhabditis auriculariae TaxID=2777116 RepID=A0A8S1HPA5_9PELO|nr:unnamed protein product [Caenorhabditis auriculariae]
MPIARTSCETAKHAVCTAKLPGKSLYNLGPHPNVFGKRIHIDFAGPDQGQWYLVVVDAKSKYPEVKIVHSISAANTVKVLKEIFARNGYPETIVSDNGTQFTSQQFADMCQNGHIQHIRTAPYCPQSNGQAERFVDTLKRALLGESIRRFHTNQLKSDLSHPYPGTSDTFDPCLDVLLDTYDVSPASSSSSSSRSPICAPTTSGQQKPCSAAPAAAAHPSTSQPNSQAQQQDRTTTAAPTQSVNVPPAPRRSTRQRNPVSRYDPSP